MPRAGASTDVRRSEDEGTLRRELEADGVDYARVEDLQERMESGLGLLREIVDGKFESGDITPEEYDVLSTLTYIAEDGVTGD